MPVTIFAYCYPHIFRVVRRQGKVSSGQGANAATAPRDRNAGQVQQLATGATTGPKLSRTQLNILQTMIAVIVCFVVCWTPTSLTNIIQSLTVCSQFLVQVENMKIAFKSACFSIMYCNSRMFILVLY